MRVCVIGGGPAGMTAAITAAENGMQTVLLEHGERVGKKLLQTGNGKCNYTNMNLTPPCYHSDREDFPMSALIKFGPEDTVEWFRSLGVEPFVKEGGYVYPHSGQAASVLNALRSECGRTGVRVVTACTVKDIRRKKDGGFRVLTDLEMFTADRLILACGSKASPGTGSDGSGFALAEKLGHRIVEPLPALCGLYCAEKEFFRSAAGVRVNASVRLMLENREVEREEGEVQLTSYGLSGIPVFQVSRTASRALHVGRRVEAEVNFLPDFPDAAEYLKKRISARDYGSLEALGNGLLNKSLWNALLRDAGLKPGTDPGKITEKEVEKLAETVTASRFRIIRTAGFDQAQCCTGGVDVRDVDPETMESRLVPGLRFAGEILDVDGICGGYNLQWCWTSGKRAGRV